MSIVTPPLGEPLPTYELEALSHTEASIVAFSEGELKYPSLAAHRCRCDRCWRAAPLLCCVRSGPSNMLSSTPDDATVEGATAPYRCPLRRATPQVPARFATCNHLSCFDCFAVLHQWLHRLEGYDWDDFISGALPVVRWRCPCCNAETNASIHEPIIVIDGWLLRKTPTTATGSSSLVLVQGEDGTIEICSGQAEEHPTRLSVVTVGE